MDSPTELSDHVLRDVRRDESPTASAYTIRTAVHTRRHRGGRRPVLRRASQKIVARKRRRSSANFPRSTPAPTRSSPITCPWAAATAWSTATARSSLTRRRGRRARAGSARCRTSSSMPGTSSGSARGRSSRSISRRRTSPAELWLAEGFTQYYGSLIMARAGLAGRQAHARRHGGRRQRGHQRIGPPVPFAGRDERAGAVHRRGARRSIRPTSRRRSSRTTPTAAPSRSGSISRCATRRTAGSRSTTTCARSGASTASPAAETAWTRRKAVHARRPARPAGRGVRRPRVRGRLLTSAT